MLVSLVNIDLYNPTEWAALPAATELLLLVHLDSREKFAISLRRRRVGESHELLLSCRVRESKHAEKPVPVNAMCFVRGEDMSPADVEAFHKWHDGMRAELQAWLAGQYAELSAAVGK